MKETEVIKRAARLVQASLKFHALIIEGPAGWGKSTTIDLALKETGLDSVHLGAYSTPLDFFNFLHENYASVILIDDTAGLFGNELSMSLLKAATWPKGDGRRIVRWGTSSSKANAEEFEFRGKLIIVCNRFPQTDHAIAVKSRSVTHRMSLPVDRAKTLLTEAAENRKIFPDATAAEKAAKYLCGILNEDSLHKISYRTLELIYEVITGSPDDWQIMASNLIAPTGVDPVGLIKELSKGIPSVKEQEKIFIKETGFKRRTFYKYRRGLKLSRGYSRN